MALFNLGWFVGASGQSLPWKIECDALTVDDWACLAFMIRERSGPFGSVVGIPSGGIPLQVALEKYVTLGPRLLVDDVYTTGGSIAKHRQPDDLVWVVFARKPPQDGVKALFCMGDK